MIEIELNKSDVLTALQSLSERTANLQPAMTEIGEYIASEVDLNFRDESDPYGNDWEPLSPYTLANRQGDKILNDTGRLKSSITSNPDSDSVEIGTNVEYSVQHQYGAVQYQYGTVHIPARPFLPTDGLPSDWGEEVLDIINAHLYMSL